MSTDPQQTATAESQKVGSDTDDNKESVGPQMGQGIIQFLGKKKDRKVTRLTPAGTSLIGWAPPTAALPMAW